MSDATRILQEQPSDYHPMVAYHKMTDLSTIEMSGQKYKRTNFEDDDNTSMGGTPPGITYDPAIAFKVGAGFWQKRTNMERLLLVASLILAIVVIILAAMVASHQHQELCMSKSCITVASTVINSIDSTTDPCDDFYQYACGGWIKKHPIPSGQSRWGTFSDMWRQNQLALKNELEKPLNESKSEAEKKARLYYQSCMDVNKTVEKLGAQPLIDLLNELGCWNVTCSNWDGESWDFTKLLKKLHALGLSVFFNTWIGEDEKNSNKNVLQFDQDGLGLARDQYMNKTVKEDKILSAYLKFMVDIGELLGGDRNETEKQMMDVILFEQQLANITVPQEERRDDMQLYHKITLAEMNALAPFMNWVDYVNTLLNVTKFNVTSSEKIVVFAPGFLKAASELITQMNSTADGRNTLNNYMLWHLVKLMAFYLSKPFREAKKEFSEVLSGSIGYQEDWRYCTTDTDGTIGFALGAMFVRAAFKGNSKAKAESMIQEIKDAFKKNLPRLEWMDDETRKAAVDKANAVIDMIGFPAYILNATELDKRYEQLDIKSDEYFVNNLRDLKFNMRRNLEKLRKAPDKTSWSMTPPTVNAYYTPTKNEIVFPAGILQAPFYSPDYPKSLNFGGMGVVMGHELTHGFDDQGREYDKHGILRPWWNNASIDRFIDRTKCIVDQYSKFSINGDHVRGKQTLGENIADNGGLKSAYNAYVHYTHVHGEENPLPGLSLTHRQLFFVAFAQVWCSNSKPQSDHMAIITDPHSPAKFRVIGPLSNSDEFAENFKCPAGTKMNPIKKCEVW